MNERKKINITETQIDGNEYDGQVELQVSPQLHIKTNEIKLVKMNGSNFDSIIIREHYLHRANSTKPAIHYGFYYKNQLVALQEWSAIFKPILLRFPFLRHYEIVDNSRFLIRDEWDMFEENFCIYNLGTRVLSLGIKAITVDWENETGVKPKLLITYIDQARGLKGTVYKAANWREINNSAGKNYSKGRKKDYQPTPKKTFIYKILDDERVNPVINFSKNFLQKNWQELNEVAQYNYKPRKVAG